MPRLDSSAIRKVTYNPKTEKMNVQFVGKGKQYTYVGVPEDVYRDFVNAPSAGKFFNDNIKDDYIAVPSEFVGSVRFDSPDDEDFYEERNMYGKELNELFGFGKKKIEPDPRLVKIFKKQISDNLVTKQKAVMDRIRSRSGGRLPRDPDIIDRTFRKPVPQTLSRKIGEEISESKSVLREFQYTRKPSPRLDPNFYRLGTEKNPIRFGGGGGGAGGFLPGFGGGSKPPSTTPPTPGPSPGPSPGSGGGFFKRIRQARKILMATAFFGALATFICASLALNSKFKSMPETKKKNICDSIAELILTILAVFLAGGLSMVAIRNIIPRIKRAFANRESIKNIIEALDMDDEETARNILFDAIEDQGIRLTSVKRALGSYDYQRLLDDEL